MNHELTNITAANALSVSMKPDNAIIVQMVADANDVSYDMALAWMKSYEFSKFLLNEKVGV